MGKGREEGGEWERGEVGCDTGVYQGEDGAECGRKRVKRERGAFE